MNGVTLGELVAFLQTLPESAEVQRMTRWVAEREPEWIGVDSSASRETGRRLTIEVLLPDRRIITTDEGVEFAEIPCGE